MTMALTTQCADDGAPPSGGGPNAVSAPLVDPPSEPIRLQRPARFTLYGDSLSSETDPHLDQLATQHGDEYSFGGSPGTAICDYLPQMRRDASSSADAPDVVVLLFSGNSLTPCIEARTAVRRGIVEEWNPVDVELFVDVYRDDTIAAIETFGADTPVVLVGVPPTRGSSYPAARALDELYRTVSGDRSNVYYLSLDQLLTPEGEYHDQLPCMATEPCSPGELVPVRAADGGHLCPPSPAFCFGGLRMATMIHDAVHQLVS